MAEGTSDESELNSDDYDLQQLRHLREHRIENDGHSDFTDALAYIEELLRAIEDIEPIVYEAADERVASYEEALQDLRDTALEAKQTAEEAERDVNAAQSSVQSYFTRTDAQIDDFEDRLSDVEDRVEGLREYLGEFARQDDVEEVRSHLDEIKAQLEAFNDLSGRVEELETQIADEGASVSERLKTVEDRLDSVTQNQMRPASGVHATSTPARGHAGNGLTQLNYDLGALREAGEVSEFAYTLLQMHLNSVGRTASGSRSPLTEQTEQNRECTAPQEDTNLHLGLIALAAYAWFHPDSMWATARELETNAHIPTGDISRDRLSGVLASLVQKHSVAERQRTDVANATWEYRITPCGRRILREMGDHSQVSQDVVEKYAQSPP